MNRVEKAIQSGRCAIAVSGSLLRDAEVMLALKERAVLRPMALAGQVVSPVQKIGAEGIARAVAQPDGVLVLVDPQSSDASGIAKLGKELGKARHRPKVVVVGRDFNPFAFGALGGLKVDHERARGKAFLLGLPEPPADLPDAPVVKDTAGKGGSATPALRLVMVGREDEKAQLIDALAAGGPTVLSGPPGVGRRWLLDHALAETELQRVPDLWLGATAGADTFLARLAGLTKQVGDDSLHKVLAAPHSWPEVFEAARAALLVEGLKGLAWVVHGLDRALGSDATFFRKSRLELLLQLALSEATPLSLVLVGRTQPQFTKEGDDGNLHRMELRGLKGRELHGIFEAFSAPEFARDKIGGIHDRTFGHPMAVRAFAVAMRVRTDGAELPDDPKFMKMKDVSDVDTVRKQLAKRVDKLSKDAREKLARLAHFREPVDGQWLASAKLNRALRMELLSMGLLDSVGVDGERKYRVHPLVKRCLSRRETSDFDTHARIAELYAARVKSAEGLERLALEQEQSAHALYGRAWGFRVRGDLPDQDTWLAVIHNRMRAKEPRYDRIETDIDSAIKADPSNADAWMLRLDLLRAKGAKPDALAKAAREGVEKAGVPELIHRAVGLLLGQRSRKAASELLAEAVEMYPQESRLRTRLASMLMRVGRRKEAIEHLEEAMRADPLLADAYGLLGMARLDEGVGAIQAAEELLREAVRLAPTDPVQASRLGDLLMRRARVEPEREADLREETKTLLEHTIRDDARAPEACLLMATLVREEGGDLERVEWLLKRARKLTDRGHERNRRISVERALVQLARGELDAAEHTLRQQVAADPSHAPSFVALGHLLEAREDFVPAHAEYARAKERTAQNSLACAFIDLQLVRVQGIIEAQAKGLYTSPKAASDAENVPVDVQPPSPRVLRRSKQASEEEEAPEPAPESESSAEE